MSDVAMLDHGGSERRRIALSIAAAVAFHCVLLLGLALGPGRVLLNPPSTPVAIDLELVASSGVEDAVVAPLPGNAVNGSVAAAPAVAVVTGSAAATGRSAGGFVIPTPRVTATGQTASSGGSGFRQSGSKTGVAQSLPDVTDQPSLPAIAVVQQGKGAVAGTGSGQGTGAAQRTGQGVPVTGAGPATGGGALDLSQLDTSIAGTQGAGGAGSGAGAGGGTGQGQGTSGASGSGTGDYTVVWDKPDASVGRTVVSTVSPKIPASVNAQGLALSVTVGFTLMPSGLLSGVKVELSSGYADVDTAVLDALRRWLFTAVKGTLTATGQITYVIRVK